MTTMGSLNPWMQEWQEFGQQRFSFFNFLSTFLKILIAYAQFTQVDLNVVYRDNTGYDQGGLGSGWSPVPGGKMRLVMTSRRSRMVYPFLTFFFKLDHYWGVIFEQINVSYT